MAPSTIRDPDRAVRPCLPDILTGYILYSVQILNYYIGAAKGEVREALS